MAAQRVISGGFREVWIETVPQVGGPPQIFTTGIRIAREQLSRVQAILSVTTVAGTPSVFATLSVSPTGFLVAIVGNGALGSSITWMLDVTLNHSMQQAMSPNDGPQVIICSATPNSVGPSGPSSVADWNPALVRYIFLDGDNGNDGNVGYIDAPAGTTFTPLQTTPVAVQTTNRAREIRPPLGANHMVVTLIKPRAGGAIYDRDFPGDGLGWENRGGVSGYALIHTRGSDLTNNIADKAQLGFMTAIPGPQPSGEFIVSAVNNGPTGGGVALSLTGAALPDGPTLSRYRARIQSGASTHYAKIKWGDPADAPDPTVIVVWGTTIPVNPGDLVWIEKPGVVMHDFIECDSAAFDGQSITHPIATAGIEITSGIAALGTGRSGLDLANGDVGGAHYSNGALHNLGSLRAVGNGSIYFDQFYLDEVGTTYAPLSGGLWADTVDGQEIIATEEITAHMCSFSKDTNGDVVGTTFTARRVTLAQNVLQKPNIRASEATTVAVNATGKVSLLVNGTVDVDTVQFTKTWDFSDTDGHNAQVVVTPTVPGSVDEASTLSVTLADLREFWGASANAPCAVFDPGRYTVIVNADAAFGGDGMLVRHATGVEILETISDLNVTGFDIIGGLRLVVRKSGLNYPGNILPCPRGTVMQMGQSEGSSDLSPGRILATFPGQSFLILADTTLDPRRCAGVLLTSCHVGMLATDGYAVVGNDGEMVVVGDGEGIGNAPWGKGVMLKAGSPGNVTCDVLESAAGWWLGQGLPAGPGDTFHSFIAWRPGTNPQTTQVSLQAPLDLVDDTLTSSADLNVDLGLGKYVVEFELPFTTGTGSPTTPGCKCVPGGGSGFIASASFTLTATRIADASGAPSPGIDACKTGVILNDTPVPSDTASQGVWVGRGFLVVTQAGLFTPHFAQVTTDGAHPTTIQAGAQMTITAIWPT